MEQAVDAGSCKHRTADLILKIIRGRCKQSPLRGAGQRPSPCEEDAHQQRRYATKSFAFSRLSGDGSLVSVRDLCFDTYLSETDEPVDKDSDGLIFPEQDSPARDGQGST